MNKKQKTKNKRLGLFALCSLLFALLPLLWNLLRPGFYTSDDGEWMVIRLTAFHDALRQGQFPVRWVYRLNHEYGYPVMNFLYPLPFYLAEPVYVLTGNPTTAIQFIMAISVISMVIGMFYLLSPFPFFLLPSSFHTYWPALVGSLMYVYSPYVALNLYQRGSFGEIVAMGIVPWIFWALSRRQFPHASVLMAALIMSHNVVAVLFFPLIVLYLTYTIIAKMYYNQSGRIDYNIKKFSVLSTALALGLSTFFWFPALTELQYVRASHISIADFQDEYLSASDALQRAGAMQSVMTLGVPLYLTSQHSSWFWESIPGLTIIQFPWRVFSLSAFTSAVVAVLILRKLRTRRSVQYVIFILIVSVTMFSSWKYLRPHTFINRPPSYYQTNDDTTTVRAEYTPVWVMALPTSRPDAPAQHYYPGWKAFAGDAEVSIAPPQETGGILKGTPHVLAEPVVFRWSETVPRTGANLISALSMLVILAWYQKSSQQYSG